MNGADAAHDGGVLGEVAVAGERREPLDEALHVVEAVRTPPGWRATCVFCQRVSLP